MSTIVLLTRMILTKYFKKNSNIIKELVITEHK